MRRSSVVVVICTVFLVSSLWAQAISADMVKGVVAYDGRGCDWYAIRTSIGYTVAEWYGGSASRGDLVVGELHSYGLKDVYNITRDHTLRVWIDDFYTSLDGTLDKLRQKNCR
jgi:hypothetical protein